MPDQHDPVEATMKVIQDRRSFGKYAKDPVSEEHLRSHIQRLSKQYGGSLL